MAISIRQIHPVFVGEVAGADLTRPLAKQEVAAIEAGMDRYGVLVFRDQRISDEQHVRCDNARNCTMRRGQHGARQSVHGEHVARACRRMSTRNGARH